MGRGGGCEVRRGEPQSSTSLLQRLPRPANRLREPLPCSARVDGMWPEKSAVLLWRLTHDMGVSGGAAAWSCGALCGDGLLQLRPWAANRLVPGGDHGARLRGLSGGGALAQGKAEQGG
jgi:hypothetical protein